MFINTYEAPDTWHKDNKVILQWLKNKANDRIKNKCVDEDHIIIEVLKLIASNDFQKMSKPLKNIIARGFTVGIHAPEDIFALMTGVLTEPRGDGNYILNQLMSINDIEILEAYNAKSV